VSQFSKKVRGSGCGGLRVDYRGFILEMPWWSFPRAITRAQLCPDCFSRHADPTL
jgi:hypothetical protein